MDVLDNIEDKISKEIEEQRQRLMAEIAETEADILDLDNQIVVLEDELELVENLQTNSESIHTLGKEIDTSLEGIRECSTGQNVSYECHSEQYSLVKILCDKGIYEAKCTELNTKILALNTALDLKRVALVGLKAALAIL